MFNLITWALGVAIAAYTYSKILTQGGMILNGLYNWLDNRIGFGTNEKARVPWLFYPLIYCCKCVAGQIALWSYFFLFPIYNPIHHIFFVTFAIYLIKFVEIAWKWQPNR
jgi:hypothetical protein